MKDLVREALKDLAPYEPGKPIEEVKRELGLSEVLKMASNENPLGPSPMAAEAVRQAAAELHLYPDGSGWLLKKRLATHLGVESREIILGNGSDEIIRMIVETFLSPGEEVVVADQAFIIYRMAAKVMGGVCRVVPLSGYTHDLEAMRREVNKRTRLVFIANPNNPTGTMVTGDQVDRFVSGLPEDVIVVCDEAYYEYIERDDFPKSIDYVKAGRPVIVLRTFSKIYGLAGLRIGYGIARDDLVRGMNRVRQPFNTNRAAQAGALAALDDTEHIEKSRSMNAGGKAFLYGALERLGLQTVPSEANFILVDVGRDGNAVSEKLLRRGVIVRAMGGYGFPCSVRVTVGKRADNERFIAALEEVLGGE